jgi:5'-3' exonuclease
MDVLRKSLMPRLGFKNLFFQDGYEADDLIATTVMSHLPLDNTRNVVISSDDDLLQLLGYCDLYSINKKQEMNLKAFQEKYGLSDPRTWAEVKTLAGCTSDKVPGLPGVGEKTAIKYLTGTLNPKNKTYAKIVSPANKKYLDHYRWLVTLPLEGTETFDVEEFDGMDMKKFKAVCNHYGFKSFLSPSTLDEWEVFFT